jgi:hypothetical protein
LRHNVGCNRICYKTNTDAGRNAVSVCDFFLLDE